MKKEKSDFLKIVSGGILAASIGGIFLISQSWAKCGKCAPPPGGSTPSVPTAPGPGHKVPSRVDRAKPDAPVLFDGTLKDESGDIDPDILDKLEEIYGKNGTTKKPEASKDGEIDSVVDDLQPFVLGGPTPDELLLKRAKLISEARLSDVYFSIKWYYERYGTVDHSSASIEREALERLGVKSMDELTSIILEQLLDPDSDLNNPGPIEIHGGGEMIKISPPPAQPVTEGEVDSVVDDLQPVVLGGPTDEDRKIGIGYGALSRSAQSWQRQYEANDLLHKKPPNLFTAYCVPVKYSDEDGDWYWGTDGHLYEWPPPKPLDLDVPVIRGHSEGYESWQYRVKRRALENEIWGKEAGASPKGVDSVPGDSSPSDPGIEVKMHVPIIISKPAPIKVHIGTDVKEGEFPIATPVPKPVTTTSTGVTKDGKKYKETRTTYPDGGRVDVTELEDGGSVKTTINADGHMAHKFYFNEDGKLTFTTIFHYDTDGTFTGMRGYNADGSLASSYTVVDGVPVKN